MRVVLWGKGDSESHFKLPLEMEDKASLFSTTLRLKMTEWLKRVARLKFLSVNAQGLIFLVSPRGGKHVRKLSDLTWGPLHKLCCVRYQEGGVVIVKDEHCIHPFISGMNAVTVCWYAFLKWSASSSQNLYK